MRNQAHNAVLDAMECHASRAEIQHYACWALSNLADHPRNRVVVATDGAHHAVSRVLKDFRNFPEVQSHGFAALKARPPHPPHPPLTSSLPSGFRFPGSSGWMI